MAACWLILAGLCLAATTVQGWHLVMKVPQRSDLDGADSVYDLWTSNKTVNPDAENVMAIQPGITYKSRDTLHWHDKSISLVSSQSNYNTIYTPSKLNGHAVMEGLNHYHCFLGHLLFIFLYSSVKSFFRQMLFSV